MITIFTCVKPVRGQAAQAQRNAISSWTHLRSLCEVLIIGEEEGAASVAAEMGVRLVRDVERNEHGMPLVGSVFAAAERESSNSLLAYVNADVILTDRLVTAIMRLAEVGRAFLLIGRRTELPSVGALRVDTPGWQKDFEAEVIAHGMPGEKAALDYFGFRRGSWGDLTGKGMFPPLVIGRTIWDMWLVYWARRKKFMVVNGSDYVLAVHQSHGYEHHPEGWRWVYGGPEVQRNLELAGGVRHCFSTLDATHRIDASGAVRLALAPANLRRRISTMGILIGQPKERFDCSASKRAD